MLSPKATEKGLQIASFVDLRAPTLLVGDPDRLRQILINLINNALKFTEHGMVTVASVWKTKTAVLRTVRKNAYGLRCKIRALAFQQIDFIAFSCHSRRSTPPPPANMEARDLGWRYAANSLT